MLLEGSNACVFGSNVWKEVSLALQMRFCLSIGFDVCNEFVSFPYGYNESKRLKINACGLVIDY